MMCFSSSKSSVERAFNLLSKLLTDQRLTTNHCTLKINDKVFTESEKNGILEKCRETFSEESTTVSQTSEDDRVARNNQDFSEEDDSENEWDKGVYENIMQKKCGSDTYDEMESTDDLESLHRWNSEYDNNFSVHNNVDVMMNGSWNHSDSDEGESFNLLDYNA